jgi:hypothetical protein
MTIATELIKAITSTSRGSARSNQVSIGPSEIGGCRRRTWNRLNNVPETNPNTLGLAAIMGTAIHSYIQKAFEAQDPFGERYILEGEFAHGELKGHVDMYDIEKAEVIDWKTTKKTGLAYFPSKQQRWQVQLYGYLIEQNGKPIKTVTLVAIPRDGDERDIIFHSEPYNREIALEALDWLKQVKETTEPPAPEVDLSFCKLYCSSYDPTGLVGCPSRLKSVADVSLITNHQVALAAHHYLEIVEEIGDLTKEKESIKDLLVGVNGITEEGVRVSWSQVAGRKTIDESKVQELLGSVPLKQGNESFRLNVKATD